MRRTGFEHVQAPADIATGYWRLPPGGQAALRLLLPPGIVGQRAGGLVAFRPFYVNGPPYGGLVGDVHDAARFLALQLGDGAVGSTRLLSAESAVAMRTLTTHGANASMPTMMGLAPSNATSSCSLMSLLAASLSCAAAASRGK